MQDPIDAGDTASADESTNGSTMWPPATPQPGGHPPIAWRPGAATAPPWYRRRSVIAAGIGLVAVILIGAVVVVPRVITGLKAPTDAGNRYLAALKRGDTAAAYEMLCSDGQAAFPTVEAFGDELRAEDEAVGHLQRYRVTNTMADVGGHDATLTFTATTDKGSLQRQAHLRKEDGKWRWCGVGDVPKQVGVNVHIP